MRKVKGEEGAWVHEEKMSTAIAARSMEDVKRIVGQGYDGQRWWWPGCR